jgi:hypothetical protein
MKHSIRFAMAVLALTIAVSDANAQGYGLLAERGLGANVGGASQENVNQFGGAAGYVFNQYVEAGISAGMAMNDDAQVNATAFGPFVGFYPVRMSPSFPVSVRLGTSYNWQLYSGDGLENIPEEFGGPMEMDGNSLTGSGALFLGIPVSSSIYLVPMGEFGYVRTSLNVENSIGTASTEDNDTYITTGAALIVMTPSTRLALTPAVTFRNGTRQFGLSAMVVLPN